MTYHELAIHYHELAQAVSPMRLGRYFAACGRRKGKAVILYKANVRLSGSLWGVLSVFEVVLRNGIDRHYKSRFGADWLRDECAPGGYLSHTECEKSRKHVLEFYGDLWNDYTHDRLVAKLGLGFWKAAFGPKEFSAAGSSLLEIFPKRPKGVSQGDVLKLLTRINNVRNRIAHHDPVCFDKDKISTVSAEECYHNCLTIMNWLGLDTNLHLVNVDFVEREIAFIKSLM
ncbi:MAG: hypothetical protein KA165_13700 [Saprospiraceae bacterium]|nr:hypothetical protein [Saprospiraceae bacterium]